MQQLIKCQEPVFEQFAEEINQEGLVLISKSGCDGSSGHVNYKQKFTGECSLEKTDSSLFSACLVPLQLHTVWPYMLGTPGK